MSTTPVNDFFADLTDENFDRVSAMDASEIKRIASVVNGGERLTGRAPTIADQHKEAARTRHWATETTEERCPDCRGSGRFRSYTGRDVGACFKCKGTGSLTRGQVAKAKGDATKAEKAAAWAADHADVIEYLNARTNWGFANSMREAIETYGSLTDKQLAAVRKCMIADAERYEAKKAERAAEVDTKSGEVDVSAIQALFARAVSNDLKKPMFRTEHLTIKASKRNNAVLFVTSPSDVYLGKIVEGKFIARWEATADTIEQLRMIAADPQAEAVKYGRQTSCCGICGRGLVDPISIRTGVGPVCAERFGFSFARELAADGIKAEVNEQAARPDALPADMRAKGVTKTAKAPVARHVTTANEIREPKVGGLCHQAWVMFGELHNRLGVLPTTAQVKAEAIVRGLNPGNAGTELPRWRKFHGLTK